MTMMLFGALCMACGSPSRITEPSPEKTTGGGETNQDIDSNVNDNASTDNASQDQPVGDVPGIPLVPGIQPDAGALFSQFDKAGLPITSQEATLLDALFLGYVGVSGAFVLSGMYDLAASDSWFAGLTFPGAPELGPQDRAGPGQYGTHLKTHQKYHYGKYTIRFRAAACASADEGVVTGLFTYRNDGQDQNQNGLVDNDEIDIEVLCAEPHTLYLTIWTDYQESGFIKHTRKINLVTGQYWQTKPGEQGNYGLGDTGQLDWSLPQIDLTKQFVTLGFVWSKHEVGYFIINEGKSLELWKMAQPLFIPQRESYFMINVWHNAQHWHNDLAADYPSQAVSARVDWFSYQE